MTREHAILAKRIINHDAGGVPIICCWDTCDRPATSLYVTRQHEHLRNVSCEGVDLGVELGRHITFAFCTHRHKSYWDNATGSNAHESIARTGRAYGNLPVGVRGRDQVGHVTPIENPVHDDEPPSRWYGPPSWGVW